MSILKDLPELLEAGVISHDTAERIEHYYRGKSRSSSNRLLMLYGLLGSILIGLGLILIIAHNWDEMSRMTKNGIALAPLILGQIMCIYTLIKKEFSQTWRECVSTFLFFSIGACLSLISQIYHLPGDAHTFVFLWMILSFPIIYLMSSSMVSLLYVIGITYYGCEGYAYHHTSQPYTYWLLLIPMLPHYYQLCKKRALSNFTTFHHWVIPISISIVLGTFAARQEEWMYVAYFVLFGVFYLIGENQLFKGRKIKANGYRVIGALGTMVLLFISSSDWFWSSLMKKTFILKDVLSSPEFITLIVLTGIAKLLLFKHLKKTKIKEVQPTAFLFLPFIATFILGIFTPFAQILINLYIFIIGIQTIRLGARRNHLGLLNYGLMIIVALVVLRFVDSHIDFVIRGILFVLTGIGFFATNLWMLKKRKTNE